MFNFKSVGHFLASAVHDTKLWLAGHQAQIDTALRTGATVISIADPALAPLATAIERASEAALGAVLATVSAGDAALDAKLLDLGFDKQTIEEFKHLITAIEKFKPGTLATAAALKPAA